MGMLDAERIQSELREVKGDFKKGNISNGLYEKAVKLHHFLNQHYVELRNDYEFDYLKIASILSEIYYMFGKFSEAKIVIERESYIYNELQEWLHNPATVKATIKEDQLTREKIRLCMDYAQAFFYSAYDYTEAQKWFFLCFRSAKKLAKNQLHCYGTFAQVSYLIGRVYKQRYNFSQAEKWFVKSLKYYQQKADPQELDGETGLIDAEKLDEDRAFCRYRSAICLGLGLGWLNFTKGQRKTALHHNIIPARVMLAGTADKLNKAYLQLLEGSIRRAIWGLDEQELKASITLIAQARDTFEEIKHLRYKARATFELALAYLYNAWQINKDGQGILRQMDELESKIARLKEAEKESDLANKVTERLRTNVAQANELSSLLKNIMRDSSVNSSNPALENALEMAQELQQGLRKMLWTTHQEGAAVKGSWQQEEKALAALKKIQAGNHTKRMEEIEKAKNELQSVISYSEEQEDWRWLSKAYTVRSQVERELENHEAAEQLGIKAVEYANKQEHHIRCKIDALISLSKTQIYLHKPDEAIGNLNQAIELNLSSSIQIKQAANPEIEAVCYFDMVLAYVLKDELVRAEDCFRKGKTAQTLIEDEMIGVLAKEAEESLRKLEYSYLLIQPNNNLQLKYHEDRLAKILYFHAYRKTNSTVGAAELMDFERTALIRKLGDDRKIIENKIKNSPPDKP